MKETTYRPSLEFLKIREREDDRFTGHRIGSLMMELLITEPEAELLLQRIDVELSMEFDQEPFSTGHYTRKMDYYVDELLNSDVEYVRDLIAQIAERLVIDRS